MVPFDFRVPRRNQIAHVQGILEKRLIGFEPTTFCMAIRQVIGDPEPSICAIYRAFSSD